MTPERLKELWNNSAERRDLILEVRRLQAENTSLKQRMPTDGQLASYKLCMDLGLTPRDLFDRIGALKQENQTLRSELDNRISNAVPGMDRILSIMKENQALRSRIEELEKGLV